MEECQLALGVENGLGWYQFEDCEPVKGPSVSARDDAQLAFAFRKRDVQPLLAPAYSIEKELKCEGCLSRTRSPSTRYNRSGSSPPHKMLSKPAIPVETRSSSALAESTSFIILLSHSRLVPHTFTPKNCGIVAPVGPEGPNSPLPARQSLSEDKPAPRQFPL